VWKYSSMINVIVNRLNPFRTACVPTCLSVPCILHWSEGIGWPGQGPVIKAPVSSALLFT